MGGGPAMPYPKWVWTPAGGWYCNPPNWKRNTGVALAGYAFVWSKMKQVLLDELFSIGCGPSTPLYLTGHGSGAAVATLAMFDLATAEGYKVEGSYMTAGFAAIKTNAGRLLHIGFDATRAVFVNVAVVNGTEPTAYKAPFSMTLDDVSVALADRVVTITTPEWILALSSKFKAGIVAAGNTCADGKCFLEVKSSPRVDVATLKVAPHGLIGQTYDGDGVGVIGKTDDYKAQIGRAHV